MIRIYILGILIFLIVGYVISLYTYDEFLKYYIIGGLTYLLYHIIFVKNKNKIKIK